MSACLSTQIDFSMNHAVFLNIKFCIKKGYLKTLPFLIQEILCFSMKDIQLKGVMKRAVKWTSTDVDRHQHVDRRRAGKVQSG